MAACHLQEPMTLAAAIHLASSGGRTVVLTGGQQTDAPHGRAMKRILQDSDSGLVETV